MPNLTRKRLRHTLAIIVILLLGFLFLWPVQVEPVAWQPPPAPSLQEGAYASNERLQALTPVGSPGLPGPEALLLDDNGHLIAGLQDGRVIRTSADGRAVKQIADTGGRPLGLAWHPDGRLLIADAKRGLLAITLDSGRIQVLHAANDADLPLGFTDDLAVTADGRHIYFSDASLRWGYGQDTEAILEHAGDGRLLVHDLDTGRSRVLLDNLQFANGVALTPDEDAVLVVETGAYRIQRYWLRGPRAGQHELFVDNLPGFPDNIRHNGRDRYWVALFAPRNLLIDGLAERPFVRKIMARALLVLPRPVEKRAMALAFDHEGQLLENLQATGSDSYAPITTVLEADNWLYFGSLTQDHLARLPLAAAFSESE